MGLGNAARRRVFGSRRIIEATRQALAAHPELRGRRRGGLRGFFRRTVVNPAGKVIGGTVRVAAVAAPIVAGLTPQGAIVTLAAQRGRAASARRRATQAERGIRREIVRVRRNIDLLREQHRIVPGLQTLNPLDRTCYTAVCVDRPPGDINRTALGGQLFPEAEMGPGGMGSSSPERVAQETGDLGMTQQSPSGSTGKTLSLVALAALLLVGGRG